MNSNQAKESHYVVSAESLFILLISAEVSRKKIYTQS